MYEQNQACCTRIKERSPEGPTPLRASFRQEPDLSHISLSPDSLRHTDSPTFLCKNKTRGKGLPCAAKAWMGLSHHRPYPSTLSLRADNSFDCHDAMQKRGCKIPFQYLQCVCAHVFKSQYLLSYATNMERGRRQSALINKPLFMSTKAFLTLSLRELALSFLL